MGIWRQNAARKRQQNKETYSLFENNDPFDDDSFLGSFREPPELAALRSGGRTVAAVSKRHPEVPRNSRGTKMAPADAFEADFSQWHRARSFRSILGYGLFAVLLAATGFIVAKYRPWALWGAPELVYAYFEVRAVDGAGRPVAGAVVKNAGKKVGTTDSFGEWRRYIRVPLGSTVPITIFKTNANSQLYATKNFAVPPTKADKSDMELRASVQLLPGGAAASTADVNSTVSPAANPMTEVQKAALAKTEANEPLVAVQKGAEAVVAPVESASKATAEQNITSSLPSFVSSHEAIWFEMANVSSGSVLQQAVLPALIVRAKELGLKVDQTAAWRVRLSSLVEPPKTIGADGAGLIQISTTDGASSPGREFLRNYQSDMRATARGILYVLAHQVNKNVAIFQKDGRWVAALPKDSSEFWRLAAGMSLAGSSRVWLAGAEAYTDGKMQGFYLQNAAELPCAAGKSSCEFRTRTFAEVPAVPTWSHLRLKLITTTRDQSKDSLKVFVSGYEAKPTGDNIFEYWGQNHAKANVTVIQNGRLLQRLQVLNDVRQTANVAVHLASVSRR